MSKINSYLNGIYPIVLLPGTLCNERMWSDQKKVLSNYTDVFIGDLSKCSSISSMAESVLKESPKYFNLAGLSMGGMVAIEIMKQSPERIKKLALLDTNPYLPTKEQISNWEYFISLSEAGRFREVTENHLIKNLLSQNNSDETLKSTIIKMSDEIGKEAMIKQMNALMQRPDLTVELPNIQVPTKVIVGKEDTVCPVEMSEYIVSEIPESTLEIIEGAGHLSSLEKPNEVTDILVELVTT